MESFVHFHPAVEVETCQDFNESASSGLRNRFVLHSAGHRYFLLTSNKGSVTLRDAWYSPEFGRREKQVVCYWTRQGALPVRMVYMFVPTDRRIPSVFQDADRESIEIDNVRIPLS